MFKAARDHCLGPSHILEGICEVQRGVTYSNHTDSNTGAPRKSPFFWMGASLELSTEMAC